MSGVSREANLHAPKRLWHVMPPLLSQHNAQQVVSAQHRCDIDLW
jgi:hypothetical protein